MDQETLNELYIRLFRLKVVEFFLYIAIVVALCLGLIFKWSMCRYICYISICFVSVCSLAVENILYRTYVF